MDVQDLLDQPVDSGLLRVASQRYSMRNEEDRTEVLAWLRPATLEQVHSVGSELVTESGERIRYLAGSGQHRLEREETVDAVSRACCEGDLERARELLEVLDALSDCVVPESILDVQLEPGAKGRMASFGATASRWAVGLEVLLGSYSPLSFAGQMTMVA
jgi:hypothetical protein